MRVFDVGASSLGASCSSHMSLSLNVISIPSTSIACCKLMNSVVM